MTNSILIEPVTRPVQGTVRVPGSKSFTNRALAVAALAEGASRLLGVLDSEDTQVMSAALRQLGIAVEHDPARRTMTVRGCGGRIAASRAELFLANSGTSIRFLAALVALGHGTFVLDGVPRMRERPIKDLLDALKTLGIDARSVHGDGCPPVEIDARGFAGGAVSIRGDVSSQFLSALLMIGPYAERGLEINVAGPLVSQPYIDMTLATMAAFGSSFQRDGYQRFQFSPGRGYRGSTYAVEPDASAASYFFGAAAITNGCVTVEGLGTASLQGDLGFVRLLETMGCHVAMFESSTTLTGGPLRGIDVDMNNLSDAVPTLAAVACFAEGTTRIRNVAHIRKKETDRLAAVAKELRKVGVEVEESPDGLTIVPRPLQSATFDTYSDHRMAMSLALLGLKIPGIHINDPGCTAKTYPEFFGDLARLCHPPD